MALVKPIVDEIVAFDATVGTTITFTASGGDQVVGNEIYVVTNQSSSSEQVVYNDTVTSFNLSHVIPPNASATAILTNGNYYKLRIRTFDAIGNWSEWSDYVPFYCYSTPILTFANISSGQTIRASVYDFVLNYSQAQGEELNYAVINLYDASNALIGTSGEMFTSPPFTYYVSGLQNDKHYKIKATAETVNGTIIETSMIPFTVSYTIIDNDNKLVATVNSCDGYVNVRSNIINKMDVESNPDPLVYIDDDSMADLINPVSDIDVSAINDHLSIYPTWARWGRLNIPTSFLLRAWFYPSRQPFEVIRLTNSDYGTLGTVYVQIKLQRSSTTDYISITTNNGVHIDRPLNTFCNGHTKIFLWVRVINSIWDVRTEVLSSNETILNWTDAPNSATGNSNIPYNITSDIAWGNEPHGSYVATSDVTHALTSGFKNVVVANGIFDELNLTTDTSIIYTTDIPDMTPQTLLKVSFDGEIGTNANYTRLLLKRKDYTTSTWLNLVDINNIPYGVPTYINFDDSYVPTGVEQTYGLVTYVNGVPSDTYTITVTPQWAKYFISDKTTKFSLNYAVLYSSHNQNIQNGILMPIGAQYPIVVQNAKGNYRSGSLQFKVLGYQYEIDKRLNRRSIVQQTQDMLDFLTNGKAKCITDFNGNIFIVKVINSPQISYDANWGNGVSTISFDWVEQGKYNNSQDMISLGLADYVAAE